MMLKQLLTSFQAHSSSASPGTHVWLLQALSPILPQAPHRACKPKSTLQSRSCYTSHNSTWEIPSCRMRACCGHWLP